jgi:hypothetical protein
VKHCRYCDRDVPDEGMYSANRCRECQRRYIREWQRDHLKDPVVRERYRERNRKWGKANLDKKLEYNRKWRKANPEKEREYKREWNKANLGKERERKREWRKANREKVLERQRERYKANREKVLERQRERLKDPAVRERNRERSREWGKANREKVRERGREWHKANPEKTIANRHRRRSRLAGLTRLIPDLEYGRYLKIVESISDRCWCCGREGSFHIDHHYPIVKGGLDGVADLNNLVQLCKRCNSSKHDKLPEEFYTVLQRFRINAYRRKVMELWGRRKARTERASGYQVEKSIVMR